MDSALEGDAAPPPRTLLCGEPSSGEIDSGTLSASVAFVGFSFCEFWSVPAELLATPSLSPFDSSI